MKSFFIIVIAAVAMIGIMIPSSFADHAEITIGAVEESGFSQDCAVSQGGDGCYTPVTKVVNYGDLINMTNTDPTGVHTFTSGTVDGFTPQPDGVFDSGVLMSGDAFQWQANVSGEVPYYCMLHTWMVGTIVVQGSGPVVVPEPTPEDYLTITGSITNFNLVKFEQPVVLMIVSPNGDIKSIQQVMPNSNGQFSDTVKLDGTIETNGYYDIQAKFGSDESTTNFYYEPGVGTVSKNIVLQYTSEPVPEPLGTLTILMAKSSYDLGELVSLSINTTNFSGTQKVSVDVTDPRGNTVVSRSVNIFGEEPKAIEFRLSEDFKTGTYKITATTSDNGMTISEKSYFKLKSQFNSFTISDVMVSDQQGNSSTLQAGEMGFIKVNLSSTKSIATLVTVNLFDSELTSIGIGSVQTTLASGESEIILSFMIPEDAAIGPADIYVNAFSDWPSNGGIALTGEFSSMEDIS